MARREIVFDSKSYQISYDLLNPHQERLIVFLHGWGSNKEIMRQAFAKTFPGYTHLYVDLPGFGHSSIEETIDTKAYTSIIKSFFENLHVKPFIIVGHSFGGKIATLLQPPVLILLSSAGIVVPKSLKVRTKIAFFKCMKPFFPKSFYRFFATKDVEGMSERMYEILKRVVDEDWSEYFSKTPSQTFIFWGKEDRATPISSGERIHTLIPKSKFYSLAGDHFFFLKQSATIEKLILESMV